MLRSAPRSILWPEPAATPVPSLPRGFQRSNWQGRAGSLHVSSEQRSYEETWDANVGLRGRICRARELAEVFAEHRAELVFADGLRSFWPVHIGNARSYQHRDHFHSIFPEQWPLFSHARVKLVRSACIDKPLKNATCVRKPRKRIRKQNTCVESETTMPQNLAEAARLSAPNCDMLSFWFWSLLKC